MAFSRGGTAIRAQRDYPRGIASDPFDDDLAANPVS